MRNRFFTLVLLIVLAGVLISCAGTPEKALQQVPEKQPAAAPAPPAPAAEDTSDAAAAVLSETELQKAETDIAALIEDLNAIIARKDFLGWKKHLSRDYIAYFSDPQVLKEQSDSPLLSKYKITLTSLNDYFNYVVVGSRKNVKLDEIKVVDRDRIKAYMYISGTPVIIYELVKINNEWKIGKF